KKSAWNFSGGIKFLLVVYRQREEILPGGCLFCGYGCYQHRGFAVSSHHGAIGLSCYLACFDDQLLTGPFHFFTYNIKHLLSFFLTIRPPQTTIHAAGGWPFLPIQSAVCSSICRIFWLES